MPVDKRKIRIFNSSRGPDTLSAARIIARVLRLARHPRIHFLSAI
jgi:hypothetical protein